MSDGRTPPRRADAWRLIRQRAGLLVRGLREVHAAPAAETYPKWAELPDGVRTVPPTSSGEADVEFGPDELRQSRDVIARLLDGVFDQRAAVTLSRSERCGPGCA